MNTPPRFRRWYQRPDYWNAVLSLGEGSALPDESALWTQLFAILADPFELPTANIYVLDDIGRFSRRSALSLSLGVHSPLDGPQVPTLVRVAQSEVRPVFADRTASDERQRMLVAPARKSAVLPMLLGDKLLGIIEASSDEARPFSRAQRLALTTLAQHAGRWYAAVDQAHSLQLRLDDAQAALERMTEQVQGRERKSLSAVETDWEQYLQRRGIVVGYDLDPDNDMRVTRASDLPQHLRDVMQNGEIAVTTQEGKQVLSAPILVRGTLLGAMSFTVSTDRRVTERQIELARSVAERLGTALENTRLFEQSRNQANRESQASAVASRLQSVVDVQTLLDLAAADFREVLGAVYARIYVNLEASTAQQQEVS